MSVGVNLGHRARAADERVVGRHAAVIAKTHDLAHVAPEVLREHAHAHIVRREETVVIVEGQVHHAVGPEFGARGNRSAHHPSLGHEQLRDVAHRGVLQLTAGEGDGGEAIRAALHVAEVDEMILLEARMHEHRLQAPRLERRGRPPVHHNRFALAGAQEAQRAWSLSNQQVAAAR